MIALPKVGPEALDGIAMLCARSMAKPPSASELRRSLFAAEQPAVVRFAPGHAVVAVVRDGAEGFIRLLLLDRELRGRGLGHELLKAAEDDLGKASVITVGADAPYFLFPGTPVDETALCCLLERHHYAREETNYNVNIDLSVLPPDPELTVTPRKEDRPELEAWMGRHWPNWAPEVMRAFDQGSLLLRRDRSDILGFCAYDVNRSGTLGPIASRPDLIGQGVGAPLLIGALHLLQAMGRVTVEVVWVGPIVPYARLGGHVGDLFFVYRRRT
ncbi:MAG TPA: GNAT family N-acetyltransferase [Acidimicrobiales bacterium]|nr:GNAT family N-acetyltransferase [Acidimicrobiales bacterium]